MKTAATFVRKAAFFGHKVAVYSNYSVQLFQLLMCGAKKVRSGSALLSLIWLKLFQMETRGSDA